MLRPRAMTPARELLYLNCCINAFNTFEITHLMHRTDITHPDPPLLCPSHKFIF